MASMSLQSAYDQARQWLESNDLERAIGLSQHILEHYPDNLEAYRILGEAYLANRQLDRAQESFERVLRSDPENIPAHVGLGITYERQGKLDRAMPEFEQALEIKPDMAELRSQLLRLYADAWGGENAQLRLSRAGLARLYAKGHMLPQAISEFRHVIADQPGRFDAMVALAEALWRDGQEEDAISLCRDILAQRPESLKANLLRGYLEMASGQPEGERYWEAARRMDPYQVVAKALFDTLPPNNVGEPLIEEWDAAAWQRRRQEEQQERMPATRPMEAVTPTAVPTAESYKSIPWHDQRSAQPSPAASTNVDDTDDFLASLLALNTTASTSQPAPTSPSPVAPASSALGDDDSDDLDLMAFSLDELDDIHPTPPAPVAAAPQPPANEAAPLMTPFSLTDLGLTEDEIAGLDSLDSVSMTPQEEQRTSWKSQDSDPDLQPFSLADLGLTEDEIDGLDSLSMDTAQQSRPPAVPPYNRPVREIQRASAPDEESFDSEDLPLDLQPFSLDELDLGAGDEPGKPGGGLPPALQAFSLDEPPPRPRVSGFAAEERFESVSDEEDVIPDTGGYSWQQPTQRPETGFTKRSAPEAPGDDVSIFAKLKQRRQNEPEPEPPSSEPLPPIQLDPEAHLDLFSLDDIPLRDDVPIAPPLPSTAPTPSEASQVHPPAAVARAPEPAQPTPTPTPPAAQEVDNLQDAIDAGQVQPFSLADLGLSAEEIAALGLGDAAPASATTNAALPSEVEEAQADTYAQPSQMQGADDRDYTPPASEAAVQPNMPESADEGDELPLHTSDLRPFSLTDLGLSDDEIAALGLESSADAEEDMSSELGITEEELAGLDLVDMNWGPPSSAIPTPPPTPASPVTQNLSGDLVVDRLIALGHQQGYVDISDIMAGVENPEAEAERIEDIGRLLHEAKVEIRDGDEVIDMDAEYAEEESLAAPETTSPEAGPPVEQEPAMTPFSLSDLGLTAEEIAALGLGDDATPVADTPVVARASESTAPVEEAIPAAETADEPVMTPFSLSDLGLTAEEIAALGLGDDTTSVAGTPDMTSTSAPTAPVEETLPAAEPATPMAEPADEPVMTPFSLSDLGLTAEEIAALGLGDEATPVASTPDVTSASASAPPVEETLPVAEPATPIAEPADEPVMTPFSLSDLGLTAEEIATLEMSSFPPEPDDIATETSTPAPEIAEPAREELPNTTPPEPAQPPRMVEEARQTVTQPVPPTPPVRPAERSEPAAAPRSTHQPATAPIAAGNEMLEGFLGQLEADPQNYALRLSVARVGGQIGMTDFAMQQYKQLIKRNELLDDVRDDLTDLISDADDQQVLQRLHRLLGDVYSKQGRFREAIDEYSWKLSGAGKAH